MAVIVAACIFFVVKVAMVWYRFYIQTNTIGSVCGGPGYIGLYGACRRARERAIRNLLYSLC